MEWIAISKCPSQMIFQNLLELFFYSKIGLVFQILSSAIHAAFSIEQFIKND